MKDFEKTKNREVRLRPNKKLYKETERTLELIKKDKIVILPNNYRQADKKSR